MMIFFFFSSSHVQHNDDEVPFLFLSLVLFDDSDRTEHTYKKQARKRKIIMRKNIRADGGDRVC
jgi:hypothetical protein